MEQGIWKTYKNTEELNEYGRTSAQQLFNDTRGSDKKWSIIDNYSACRLRIEGSVDGEYRSGDIYVYYIKNNDKLLPEFFIKVEKPIAGSNNNFISYNGNSGIEFSGIDDKYLTILIDKLKEIDKEKNEKTITELQVRNENYQKVLKLKDKENYTEEDLLFLYNMAYGYRNNIDLAKKIVSERNIQQDYDSFTEDGKVNLYISIKNHDDINKIIINEKSIITKLAENNTLKQLNYTSQEIIDDKEYILNLLEIFCQLDKYSIFKQELVKNLPNKYQTDLDILELIYFKYFNLESEIKEWSELNPELQEKLGKQEFAHQLVDIAARAYLYHSIVFDDLLLLSLLPNEILMDIENNVLIGPEPDTLRETLKEESRKALVKQKQCILNYRAKNNK